MKFISRNLNLGVTLQSGIQANPVAGVQATPGKYARFQDGIFETNDQAIIERMLKHAGYKIDYVEAEGLEDTNISSPIINGSEPEHDVTNIEYGHVGKSLNPKAPIKITPEIQKYLADTAAKMAMEMLQKMSQDVVNKQQEEVKESSETAPELIKPSKKGPKAKAEELV